MNGFDSNEVCRVTIERAAQARLIAEQMEMRHVVPMAIEITIFFLAAVVTWEIFLRPEIKRFLKISKQEFSDEDFWK